MSCLERNGGVARVQEDGLLRSTQPVPNDVDRTQADVVNPAPTLCPARASSRCLRKQMILSPRQKVAALLRRRIPVRSYLDNRKRPVSEEGCVNMDRTLPHLYSIQILTPSSFRP